MVDAADQRFDARMDRMEAVIREIQSSQAELRSERTSLRWVAGVVVTVALAVAGFAGIGLQRSFVLTDRLADVRVDTSTIRVIAEKDISAIRADVTAMRAELERVSDAVGAKPPESRADLPAPSVQ